MDPIARHLRICGLVQGVSYRYGFEQEAKRLGVNGWVRNRLDGSVEAHIEGEAEAIAQLLAWARRGPELARVESVDASEAESTGLQQMVRYPTA
ncbi:acylphosphatase [Chitinimonas lacunae]|uniref:acylphosphatase n=1 Tax=Chitinimonas lacunae TaxID=1963018 RepID=A0ABV8MIZ3_9NEIS